MFKKFEDLAVWQKSKEMTVSIYQVSNNIKDYGFKDQIQRASVSVMNNIAEGFERGTQAEFKRFLYIAKGSCGETRSMLILAHEIEYIDKDIKDKLTAQTEEISKMLSGLIKTLH
ncbi:MAG: four helix bundle protein [Bacteroidales bacterium]|nr:four helix bundle protein [Bacteroidales bacterium]